jgi:hypothetical protein
MKAIKMIRAIDFIRAVYAWWGFVEFLLASRVCILHLLLGGTNSIWFLAAVEVLAYFKW